LRLREVADVDAPIEAGLAATCTDTPTSAAIAATAITAIITAKGNSKCIMAKVLLSVV